MQEFAGGKILIEFLNNTYTIALPIVLSYIVWLLKQQNKKRDANGRGTMILLKIQLIEYHDKYCRLGYIPSYVYKNFIDAYDAYHDLGGNGLITKMKEEVDKLEIRRSVFDDEHDS